MLNPFKLFSKIFNWYVKGTSRKTKITIFLFVLFSLMGIAYAGYRINHYFEYNPSACTLCHVHDDAQKLWEESAHRVVRCKECHHATKKDQIGHLYKFFILGKRSVDPRHGQIIVPSKLCMECHWEGREDFPTAHKVNKSRYHAIHFFSGKVECTKCHGYSAHKFLPEERFCMQCHPNMEVHGTEKEKLACINCHTDRTEDLRPDRKKCLFCHGNKSIRAELIAEGAIDVKYFQPSPDLIKKATKVHIPADAPMQFPCYDCHKPHKNIRSDWGNCLKRCHSNQLEVGHHEVHVKGLNMKCTDCHKPHLWKVTESQAKEECIKCHEYKSPKQFVKK